MARAIRESLGIALSAADLSWLPHEERGVDRLVASAWTGNELGRILARVKYAGERSTFNVRRALWMIVQRMEKKGRYGKEQPTKAMIAMCAAALDEWMNDVCKECHGRKYVRLKATPMACPACSGVGRIVWEGPKRAAQVEQGYERGFYERVLDRLQEADALHHLKTEKGLL